jgi:hypothetical protein
MIDRRQKAIDVALHAYWHAQNHDEEHAAMQRLIAWGFDTGSSPCPKPECVRLRNIELALP